ncbi:PREDICTED: serine/threonine-protein kinase ATR-like [Papilio xuthus]|uniref:Serine/threonine-protein kinase ATR n=1 Tax=Papilio xuthus TaxID=66420 RepID=A0AAJ7EA51_PAPXU|nr:PREDICTED: serine/threonine-protein kinase ATR-like [Papilio xuthus]
MDEDNCDGPFTVWQMFNAPTMVLFNNLENAAEGLERLLTSISKLSGDFSEVLIPRVGSTKCPDNYYCAFNTWLLGRLFYVCSVKELNMIHGSSKDAQVKILNILCVNGASFYEKLILQYHSILFALVKYYKENSDSVTPGEIQLDNFKPEQIDVPNVQLNLEPIYVQVKNISTCTLLIDIVLQLLSECIPPYLLNIDKFFTHLQKLHSNVLFIIEHYSIEVKLLALNFFANLIENTNNSSGIHFQSSFPQTYRRLLCCIECMVQNTDVLFEKSNIASEQLTNFNNVVTKLLKMCDKSFNTGHKDVLSTIAITVLKKTSNPVFNKELKLYCLSLSNTINFPKDVLELEKRDSNEIDMLAECYYKHIFEYIKKEKCQINELKELWFFKQVVNVIYQSLEFSNDAKDTTTLSFNLMRHLSALRILQKVFINYKKNSKEDSNAVLEQTNLNKTFEMLSKLIKTHDYILLQDYICMEIFLNIVLTTTSIIKHINGNVKMESFLKSKIMLILCLQESSQNVHKILNYNECTKVLILKYILLTRLILNTKENDMERVILNLVDNIIKNKNSTTYKEVIAICPLLILCKISFASKLIGEVLLPAFLTKDPDIQDQLTKIVPAIACISLGTYAIVLGYSMIEGHTIFYNKTLNITIICYNCHNRQNLQQNTFLNNIKRDYVVLYKESVQITPSVQSTFNGLRNLLCKFLNYKQYASVENSQYWNLLERLCNHFYVFNYGLSTEIIKEENLKYIFKAIKPLIPHKTTNTTEVSTQNENVFPLCVNLLVKLTQTSLESNNYNKQIATLDAIKEFGLYCNDISMLPVTKLFIYYIMHPQCAVAPKAEVYLREFCEFHNYTPNQVYHRYKKDYCRLFVECSLYCGKDFAISLLKVVRAFGFVGYRDFISKDIHHFLPYLIPYSVTIPEVPSMIEEIASLVQCSVSDFIIERFPLIYVHVYLNENNTVADKCYSILEKLTKCSILSLIKKHFRVILTEFLLQYCCNPEKVLNACRYLACHDPDTTSPGNIKLSTTQIADFLNPKFLGVLAYFDHKLVNAKVALSVKRKALKSFPDMMQLMGVKYITPLRFKVLATLRSALPLVKEFPKILADAWSAFIHNLDSISLGPLLSNLAVSLLQQFEYAPQEINKIFQYLVLKNENLLSAHLSDLFFLGDSNISEKVKTVIKRHVTRTQPEGFLDKIKWYLEHLNNEIPRIKAYAISHLDVLLKNNRSEIHKAIFGGKNIDPIIVELIDCLLLGCKDPDNKVSEASGSCLGQLGAIEAGHLPRQYVQPDRSPFAFTIVDNCFAATALVELSRAFQYEKDTMNMDCYALTIQEILKTYEISPTGSKKEVWDSFPENMHQIMYPLLSSRYTLAYPSQPKKVHPLFGSVYATTFLEWAHNWTGQLISIIESESIRDLLRTVHPSMRRDLRTLLLFFPYSRCSKTIYSLFDFLNRWLLEWCHVKQRPTENENYKAIQSFMDNFDKLTIARGSFACGELERALQYLELYMDERKERVQEQLPLLAEIYALLDEPDSVAGILSIKRSEPSLKELILAQVVTGRLQDAALCYERLAQEGQLDRNSMQGMIDCYLSLDQPFTAHRLLSERDSDDMTELAAEPLWRLGRFEELDRLTQKPVPPSRENWGLLMGRVLLAYRKQDHDTFVVSCKDATSKLLSQMDGKSRGESALRSGYQSVLGLHIVKEAEHAEEVLCRLKNLTDGDNEGEAILSQLLDEWRRRLAVVQSDVRTVEPLLRLRRILLQQTQELLEPTHPMTANRLKASIGDLWLQSAKHARKAGIYQQSYMYILNAEEYHPEELFIEKSKMYWARGQQEHAFTTLRRGLDETYPQIDRLTQEQRKICAKAKLLIAKYNDETTKVDVDVNIGYYKESVEVFKQWEKSLVCLGAYYEKVSSNDTTPNSMTWSRRIQALNSYGKALQYGHKYLYQSMPRMLSIWLDMEVTSADTGIHTVLAQMTEIIKTYSERLPIYLYLTAFSQIVSRICHPVREVYLQLKAIIVKLILAYPQHTLWMMMCVIKSSYPQRIKRCSDVFSDPRLKDTHMLKLVADFNQFAEKLIELCNKPIPGNNTKPTVSSLVRTLPRLLVSDNFSRIMIPFEEFCKIVLPSKAARQERIDFNIPKEPAVYIAGIEEDIQILPSLQKPRKVTLKGSDGKSYIILLKSRDDLRKDFRLMEFNGVVNRFLQDAAETRRRRLYIRTYCVLPLNEECGLIQWVPNLLGLRPILLHIYKQKGIHTTNRELKELMCSKNDPLDKMRRIFEQHLLRKHPPVFQEWFRRVFSDPYGWYQARSAYIRTTAVMSMVGYILGLGDRHGENISFDSTNGDTVHVDFNCLFNKGETFEWPERVPFRLTHNMEAAMGPLKHEGMFRKCCEAVMRVLCAQTAALMSVVGPFVYDPLVSWGRARLDCAERTNSEAVQHLAHIRHRLNGMVRTKNKKLTLSLSPEGQVEHLIVEATSIQNLCQMYIGWGPFL